MRRTQIVAVDAEGFNTATSQILGLLTAGLSVAVVAMTVLSWVPTGRALDSVARITGDAEAVRPQDLASGLPAPTGTPGVGCGPPSPLFELRPSWPGPAPTPADPN